MDLYDVVIPARDEARTIEGVVRPACAARGIGKVWVVDDDSSDGTAAAAQAAGAHVIRSFGRGDKALALATGVAASRAAVLVFFDGDILNASPTHFEALVEPVLTGCADLSCGLVDYGTPRNSIFLRLPPITGLRALKRSVFEAIPREKLRGFQIEIMINEVIARGLEHARMTLELLDCFRFVPLWTYGAYLRNLKVLPPSGRRPTDRFPPKNQSNLENVS
ncbi:MAG: glycosyltransferase [Acidobacteria bacterium]|nr:glycosyltransferase [Acidobacteriota bacterium]